MVKVISRNFTVLKGNRYSCNPYPEGYQVNDSIWLGYIYDLVVGNKIIKGMQQQEPAEDYENECL